MVTTQKRLSCKETTLIPLNSRPIPVTLPQDTCRSHTYPCLCPKSISFPHDNLHRYVPQGTRDSGTCTLANCELSPVPSSLSTGAPPIPPSSRGRTPSSHFLRRKTLHKGSGLMPGPGQRRTVLPTKVGFDTPEPPGHLGRLLRTLTAWSGVRGRLERLLCPVKKEVR